MFFLYTVNTSFFFTFWTIWSRLAKILARKKLVVMYVVKINTYKKNFINDNKMKY